MQVSRINCRLLLHFPVRLCHHLRKQIEEVLKKLIASERVDGVPQLVHELEKAGGSEFTAWDMFDINRKFVLSFVSSLITFTVLFIQITSSAMGK